MNIKGECQHCGESIDLAITKAAINLFCPHCGKSLLAEDRGLQSENKEKPNMTKENAEKELPAGWPKLGEGSSEAQEPSSWRSIGILLGIVAILLLIFVSV